MTSKDQLIAGARELLPAPVVEPWVSLLRPGIQLRPAVGDEPVVAHFGGDPLMPPDEEWPKVQYGVLNHMLTLDLARFPNAGLDLPVEGLLTFFAIGSGEMAGTVRYYPSTADLVVREEEGRYPPNRVALTAVERWTVPDEDHSYMYPIRQLIDEYEEEHGPAEGTPEYEAYLDTPEVFETDEYWNLTNPQNPSHLIGGYGRDVQTEADFAPTMEPVLVPGDEGPVAETELPILLAQIDSDHTANIQWGDVGTAMWTISREDLAARRFENARHYWNCH